MKFLFPFLIAFLPFISASASPEIQGYRLLCESDDLIFTFEVADPDIASGTSTLNIFEKRGRGTVLRATTTVKAILSWKERLGSRYISALKYSVGDVINFEIHEKRNGYCENALMGGTRYRASVKSNQPMLEVNGEKFECESMRIFMGSSRGSGTTSM